MLRRWICTWSPATVGLIVATAVTGMLFAYDICADGRLAGLPTLGGCHCWVAAAAGLVLGALCAAVVAVARRLLEPLLVRIWSLIVRLVDVNGAGSSGILRHADIPLHRDAPLARRRASRAPPFGI